MFLFQYTSVYVDLWQQEEHTCCKDSDTAKENNLFPENSDAPVKQTKTSTLDTPIKVFLKNHLLFPRKNEKIIFNDILCKIFHFSLDAPDTHSKFNF